jgi:hypothetical protein
MHKEHQALVAPVVALAALTLVPPLVAMVAAQLLEELEAVDIQALEETQELEAYLVQTEEADSDPAGHLEVLQSS